MRKGVAVLFAAALAVASASSAFAVGKIPTISLIPDIVVGDVGTPGQTADNYFVNAGQFNPMRYVTDEDSVVEIGFDVQADLFDPFTNPFGTDAYVPVLSIGSKSEVTTIGRAAWEAGNLPDIKNILKDIAGANQTTLTVRSVSELWAPAGPDLPVLNPAFDSARMYGLGNYSIPYGPGIPDQAVVSLLVSDTQGNTATRDFIVKCLQDTTSTLEHDLIAQARVGYLGSDPRFFFAGINLHNPANPPTPVLLPAQNRVGINMTNVPSTNSLLGFWEGIVDMNPGGSWIDALYRARWNISTNATDVTQCPVVRSRLKSAATSVTTVLGSSSQLLNPSLIPGGDPTMKSMLNDNQIEFRHYYYGGQHPLLLNGPCLLQVDIDAFDFDPNNAQNQIVFIDQLILETMDHPTRDAGGLNVEYVNRYNKSGVNLAEPEWINFLLQFFAPNFLGSIQFSTPGDGLRAFHPPGSYNVFGFWFTGALANMNQGELVRSVMTIKDNQPAVATKRVEIRLRLSTGSSDMVTEHNLFAGGIGQPVAAPGTVYELYQETPAIAPGFGSWQAAMDLINIQGDFPPGPLVDNQFSDVTITGVQLQSILLPY